MTNASFTNTKFVVTLQMRYNLKLLVQCLSESDMELSMYSGTKTYFSSTELMETTQIKYTLNSVRTIDIWFRWELTMARTLEFKTTQYLLLQMQQYL